MTTVSILFLLFFSTPSYAKLENFQAADVVLGQPDFTQGTANNGGISSASLSSGAGGGFCSDGQRLFVVDRANNRVLIWNSIPDYNFKPADVVLGQTNFTGSTANAGGTTNASAFDTPLDCFSDGTRFFVADGLNHRVLIWNSIPTQNFQAANVVVGQTNFTANGAGTTASGFNVPHGVATDGKRLFVAEFNNQRVLIYNSIPTTNGQAADVVLGQPDFTSATVNNGGVSARSIANGPTSLYSDGKRLFIVDWGNHRVLIWKSIPTENFKPADIVLGQPNFNSNTANSGGLSARSLFSPVGVFSDGKNLFVADTSNNRTLIWNTIPTANFASADIVLGQPDFTSNTANNGGRSAKTLNDPRNVITDGLRLFIADRVNNRLLIYNIASGSGIKLSPQFEQGKAVLGKVFHDVNGDGIQNQAKSKEHSAERKKWSFLSFPNALIGNPESRSPTKTFGDDTSVEEKGLEGIKVMSDTGIYAITDSDGKYHFPYLETGQRVLKIDPITLPEGATLTTESPRKVVVTKGILTKVSFGVKLPESSIEQSAKSIAETQDAMRSAPSAMLLEVSITQDPVSIKPHLSIEAVMISVPGMAGTGSKTTNPNLSPSVPGTDAAIRFTIHCNYFLFIHRSELTLYDQDLKKLKTFNLPKPLPLHYEVPITDVIASPKGAKQSKSAGQGSQIASPIRPIGTAAPSAQPALGQAASPAAPRNDEAAVIHYQLSVFDAKGNEDRTGVGRIEISQ